MHFDSTICQTEYLIEFIYHVYIYIETLGPAKGLNSLYTMPIEGYPLCSCIDKYSANVAHKAI